MTDHESDRGKSEIDEQKVAELLRLAGRRPPIDPERQARVYARTLDAWQEAQAQPAASRVYASVLTAWKRRSNWSRRRRWMVPAALAASALLAVMLVTQPPPAPAIQAGTITRVVADTGTQPAYTVDDAVFVDDVIETGPGLRLGIMLAGGESLRIDSSTRLHISGRQSATLEHGRLYADTGDLVYRRGNLAIDTAFGSVTDIGTQFAVSLQPNLLDVAVREGRVDVSRATAEYVALAGERLLLPGDREPERQALSPTAEFWDWTIELAPAFEIENRSLLDFLKWVSRETGLELVFPAAETRVAAMRTDLHGSIANLAPQEALEAVLATTVYSYRVENGRLIIER